MDLGTNLFWLVYCESLQFGLSDEILLNLISLDLTQNYSVLKFRINDRMWKERLIVLIICGNFDDWKHSLQ